MISDPTPQTVIQDRDVARPRTTSFKNLWIGLTSLVIIIVAIGTFLALNRASTVPHTVAKPASSKVNVQHTTQQNTTTAHSADLAAQTVTLKGTTPEMKAVATPDALALITQYYANINAKNYQSAYSAWGSQYQSGTSYTTFANGFANTQKVDLVEGTSTLNNNGTVDVNVTITATDQTPGATVTNVYQGYYYVGQENATTKIITADLLPTSSSNAHIQQAGATLQQYYADINSKNYQAAYNLWGTTYHQSTSYQQFAAGFANTQSVRLIIGDSNTTVLVDGSVKLSVAIAAENTTPSGTVVTTYQGYYIVGTENSTSQIFSANIQQTSTTTNRIQQATNVLNQYYANINAKNYQDAYNLWGIAYHNYTPYQRFATGFANTRNVTISIETGHITVLIDGSVKIPLSINAINANTSGTVTHSYHGYYIIGTEFNTWQLFGANIQQIN